MIYPTLRATVRRGKIRLLDEVQLPENALVLVTIMDDAAIDTLTVGERLAVGLHDILLGQFSEVNTAQEMASHLDKVFEEA